MKRGREGGRYEEREGGRRGKEEQRRGRVGS